MFVYAFFLRMPYALYQYLGHVNAYCCVSEDMTERDSGQTSVEAGLWDIQNPHSLWNEGMVA
jgi:hypothetical protein